MNISAPQPKPKAASKANRGKKWEQEIRSALLAMDPDIFEHGFDNIGKRGGGGGAGEDGAAYSSRLSPRPADRVVCWRGYLVLIECKECLKGTIPRTSFTEHEEESLWKVTRAGGLAVVAIRYQREDGEWEAWLCHYAHLLQAMRDAGRKSFPVTRCPSFGIPLERAKVGKAKGLHWRLSDGLAGLRQTLSTVTAYSVRSSIEFPREKKQKAARKDER